MSRYLVVVLLALCSISCDATYVTIRNDVPRYDTQGNIVDCHSGNIVKHDGIFFLYGEHYGRSTGFNETHWPRLHVYSSTDLVNWEHHGEMLLNAPGGTYFTPYVVFNKKTNEFVVWWNYYPHGCCQGNFGVAKSTDGIHFTIVGLNVTGYYPTVDSNGLFVDTDGTAYVVYSSIKEGHKVSIEKLTPDYYTSTHENYGFLPDTYVEGSTLFKRGDWYYVLYGKCCCFCRAGSGVIVHRSKSLKGPWLSDGDDKNCKVKASACPVPQINVHAQGIGLSVFKGSDGEDIFLWSGERWLSAPHNNPECPDECRATTGKCKEPKDYIKGHGFMYWIPLAFDKADNVTKFAPFVDKFTLDL